MSDYSMSVANIYEGTVYVLVEMFNFIYAYCEYCVDNHMT